jgi:hypothetical protein
MALPLEVRRRAFMGGGSGESGRLRRFSRRMIASLFALGAASTGIGAAADGTGPSFTFNGYATFGFVHSSEERADFLGGLLVESGAGWSREWSPEVDSRVGAQITATFNDRLSAVVQVLAEQRADGSYTPHLEWANLSYRPTADSSVRIGRIVLPSFLVSDFRNVGYAHAWVRPPVEVYGLIPVTTNDGLDASRRFVVGDFSNTIQLFLGQGDTELPGNDTARARDTWGVTGVSERGAATGHVSYQQADLSIGGFNRLFDAFRQFGPEGAAIADRYDADRSILRFLGLGALYDPGRWFAMAEWGSVECHCAIGDRAAWYVSGGYRFGKLTPFLTYAESRARSRRSDPGLTASAYPPEAAGAVAGLNTALNALLSEIPVQDTVSLGVRWDFAKNLDLKLQLDHSRVGAGSAGSLGNLQPGYRRGGNYDLVSVAVDLLF